MGSRLSGLRGQGGQAAIHADDLPRYPVVRRVEQPRQRTGDGFRLTQAAQREALLQDLQAPALIQLCGALPAALAKPASSASQIATAPLGAAA